MSDFNLEEKLNLALDRIETLENEVAGNKKRIKNSRALNALLVFCLPVFLISADVHLGEKVSADVRSRDIDAGDLLATIGIGASALGVIGFDELVKLSKLLSSRTK